MAKKLLRALFSTFIIAVIISIAASCLFYAISEKGGDYGHAVLKIISGTLFLNLILLIMSLPVLFLANGNLWQQKTFRLILYFAGAIIFIISILFINLQPQNRVVYLIISVVFLLTHSYFYYRLVKK